MRRPLAALLLSLCLGAGASAAVAAPAGRPGRLPLALTAAARGEPVTVAGSPEVAEVLTLPSGLAAGLLATRLDEQVRVAGWPVAPGKRADVVLTRGDVYAPGAKIWATTPQGLVEVPRSPLVFLWGQGERDLYVHVMAAVDPETGEVSGLATTPAGVYELRTAPAGLRRRGAQLLAAVGVVPDGSGLEGAGLAAHQLETSCGQRGIPADLRRRTAAAGLGQTTAAAITSLHTATIAIDTDNELMQLKFGNDTTSASTYLAQLFASMNVIYERDLLVRLLQGTTFLRISTVPDPYDVEASGATSTHLNEVKAEWQNLAYAGIPRALVALLSGKSGSPNSASGIASLAQLCDTANGFSYTQVFKFAGSTGASDGYLVAHELGHNFGAPHTHCHNPPVDNCANHEPACFSGTRSCPAPAQTINGVTNVTGTLMSYCHLLNGCVSGQTNRVFHPASAAVVHPLVEARVGQCILPALAVAGVSPNTGSVLGGDTVTIHGAGFDTADPDSDVVVTFDGVPATVLAIPDSTSIQVVTPPHATGAVAVAVDNPDASPAATRQSAYFYSPIPQDADFYTLTPCRLLDTRSQGGILAAGESRLVQATGAAACIIPAAAVALSANVTVVGPATGGFVSVYPGNAFFLGTSTMNFSAARTRANNAVLMLATDGAGTLRVLNGSGGAVHVLVDVNGYFEAP